MRIAECQKYVSVYEREMGGGANYVDKNIYCFDFF